MKKSGQTKKEPSIVCIGGGTGLSTMLRGLKLFLPDITAIVAVTDDGGGSGVLRDELGMPPPGDIRNCILALSNVEPTMGELMSYRFDSGSLAGQSFGNLFLAAMNGISESFDKAVARTGEVLAITGRVLPVTNEDIRLKAVFEDGSEILGESKIPEEKQIRKCRIDHVQLVPRSPKGLQESIDAISNAEMIVFGPGSLYTSIIPNLLVGGIAEAVAASDAIKLYVCNLMTQPGETDGYTASDHIKALFQHSSEKLFDLCLLNNKPAEPQLLEKYTAGGADIVLSDIEEIKKLGVEVHEAPLFGNGNNLVRHDPRLLAREIMGIFREKAPTREYG